MQTRGELKRAQRLCGGGQLQDEDAEWAEGLVAWKGKRCDLHDDGEKRGEGGSCCHRRVTVCSGSGRPSQDWRPRSVCSLRVLSAAAGVLPLLRSPSIARSFPSPSVQASPLSSQPVCIPFFFFLHASPSCLLARYSLKCSLLFPRTPTHIYRLNGRNLSLGRPHLALSVPL